MARVNNISAWNAKMDNTYAHPVWGGNGIHYLYFIPKDKGISQFYKDAIHVQSIKGNNTRPSTSKKHFGKVYRPGQYQPIGDRKYFTYYQLRKMKNTPNSIEEIVVKVS